MLQLYDQRLQLSLRRITQQTDTNKQRLLQAAQRVVLAEKQAARHLQTELAGFRARGAPDGAGGGKQRLDAVLEAGTDADIITRYQC